MSTNSLPHSPFAALNRGPLAYVALTAYIAVTSILMLTNTRTSLGTDVSFVLFLLGFLLLYRARVSNGYKLALGAIMLIGVVPYFGTMNAYYIELAIQAGIFVALALGLNVVVGFAGLLDLGYVAFFAVGAYLWGIFSTDQIAQISPGASPVSPQLFYLFMALGLFVGAFFGVLLGLPVLRLRGDYLAIVTLGLGEVIRVLAVNLDRPINITNGSQGIKSIARPPLPDFLYAIFPGLDNPQLYQLFIYALALLVVGITVLTVFRLKNSRIGRAWEAIREDETAAIAMGVPLVRMKLMAFAVGASFAGVMGVLFAAKQQFINPPTFDLIRSIGILAMVILGGMGSIPGVILGGVLVTLLDLQILPRIATELGALKRQGIVIPDWFDPAQYQRALFGLLLILMMIFRPEGILPDQRRREEAHETAVQEAPEEAEAGEVKPV
ncbi:MAG: branched-chain amino acid ABC transporter permease [Candidatus Roseilinea sp.]|nr:MAG: branched-chain amino acid ABC transporter permease [Candidatus Roseilinea sp.]